MTDYKLLRSGAILRNADGASIPADSANTDYAAYLDWVVAGGVADPADPPSKDEINGPILAQIEALDVKRVRPAAEIAQAIATGGTPDSFSVNRLVVLSDQIAALRAQLVF